MKWTVRSKLAVGFGAVLTVLVVLVAFGFYRDRRIEERVETLQRRGVVLTRELRAAGSLLHRIRGRAFYHLASKDLGEMAAIEREVEEYERGLLTALDHAEVVLGEDDPRRAAIGRVRAAYRAYAAARNQEVLAVSRRGDKEQALRAAVDVAGPLFTSARVELEALIGNNVEQSERVFATTIQGIDEARRVTLLGSAFAMALAFLAAAALSRDIAGRIAGLAGAARAVRDGKLDTRSDVGGADEVKELSLVLNQMTEELANRIDAEREIGERQSEQRKKLATTVGHYGEFVARVARGELAAELEHRGDGELAALGDNLEAMARGLRTMTLRMHETVGALSTATAEILTTTQEHSAGAAESAAAVSETVATVEEVAQTARQTSERAKEVSVTAQRSVEVSAAGREAAERAASTMAHVREQVGSVGERILALADQAQAVGQIVTTVNELAEQSNLLALNASIEAARAGEAGRAFSVVAAEIRTLAEQSKRATGEIRGILGDVQKSTAAAVLATEESNRAVASGVERVRDAGARFDELAEAISASARAAEAIFDAAQQQAAGVGQISQAMQSINQATAQTVEGTRQTERAARDLNELSGRLRDAVSQYRT